MRQSEHQRPKRRCFCQPGKRPATGSHLDVEEGRITGAVKEIEVVDFLASSISAPAVNVINFAVPGATVENDLEDQLAQFFDRFPKKAKSSLVPALNPEGATYVFFLGINDCGRNSAEDLDSAVEALFDVVHRLYIDATARNFILVDVPPIDRSPAALASKSGTELKDRIETWNDLLLTHASDFVSGSKQASLLLFSSDKVLTEVLDEPLVYDFDRDDVDLEDGDIWQDTLHITSAVHKIIATHMANALGL
ncbi:carbohydrate esterase family 16 protein [Paxillus involutus ATCC 200175]|nr:carbohydrate esterase family 16 protein [Paxillus involutus ATCC 200175]